MTNNQQSPERHLSAKLQEKILSRWGVVYNAAPEAQRAIFQTHSDLFDTQEATTATPVVAPEVAGAVIDSAVQKDQQNQTVADMQLDRIRHNVEGSYDVAA